MLPALRVEGLTHSAEDTPNLQVSILPLTIDSLRHGSDGQQDAP